MTSTNHWEAHQRNFYGRQLQNDQHLVYNLVAKVKPRKSNSSISEENIKNYTSRIRRSVSWSAVTTGFGLSYGKSFLKLFIRFSNIKLSVFLFIANDACAWNQFVYTCWVYTRAGSDSLGAMAPDQSQIAAAILTNHNRVSINSTFFVPFRIRSPPHQRFALGFRTPNTALR